MLAAAVVEERPRVDLQGHRGARGLAPENTLPGFERALAIGVSTLELDTVVTRDGVVVLSHDPQLSPDLARTPDGRWLEAPGPVIFELSHAELKRYDVGRLRPGSPTARRFPEQVPADGARIPTLDEVLALAGRAPHLRFNIETKIDPRRPERTPGPDAFADAVIERLRRAGLIGRASLQSFDWRTLRRAAQVAPALERVCLTSLEPDGGNVRPGSDGAPATLAGLDVDDYDGSLPRLVEAAGCPVWSPRHQDLSDEALAEAHELGLRVVPWTANEVGVIEALLARGVDGVISDYPDRLRDAARRAGLALPPAVGP